MTTFAGFSYPRKVWALPTGTLAQRFARRREPRLTGDYFYNAPPMAGTGSGGYLNQREHAGDGMPRLRLRWAEEVLTLRHSGWYTDEDCSGVMRGIIARLPRGRGFLAGWSMGANMATYLDPHIWADEREAARAADQCAEYAAEKERDYQRNERARLDAEELAAEQERRISEEG